MFVRSIKSALVLAIPMTMLFAGIMNAQVETKDPPKRQEKQKHTVTKQPLRMNLVETADSFGKFKTLLTAAKSAGIMKTLSSKGPFTLFAPTDEAFKKLPKGTVENLLKPENKKQLINVLKYHVVSGNVMAADVIKLKKAKTVAGQDIAIKVVDGKVVLNGKTKVVKTDIKTNNGVIHVVDSVILPPKRKDIIDTAVSAEKFTTLVAAIKAAGLVDTLKGEGPFTVFAPNDEAFAKIPKAKLDELLKPENKKQLTAILAMHVISGKAMAADVVKKKSAKTVNGQEVQIVVEGKNVMINGVKVIATDVECGNGVIHVVDTVIMPK